MKHKPAFIKNETVIAKPTDKSEAFRVAQPGPIGTHDSSSGPFDFLQSVQDTVGNRAVGHWIQRKLKIGAPNDAHEQEADRIADQAMRTSNPATAAGNSISDQPAGRL